MYAVAKFSVVTTFNQLNIDFLGQVNIKRPFGSLQKYQVDRKIKVDMPRFYLHSIQKFILLLSKQSFGNSYDFVV